MADSIGTLAVAIGVDTSALTAGMQAASNQVAGFASGISNRANDFMGSMTKGGGGGFLSSIVGNANDATNKFENGVGGVATAFGTASHAAKQFGESIISGNFAGAFTGMASAAGQVVSQMVGFGVLRHAVAALTSPVGLVAAGLTAVFMAGRSAIHAIADMNDEALKFGMSAVDYQKFGFALEQVGVQGEQAGAVMSKLRAKIGDLQSGEEGATKAFERLGLDRQALEGKDTSEAMGLISDRLRGVTDSNVRASIAMDIFGKKWHEIEEFALRGSAYFAEAAARAQRFGAVLSNDVVESLEATSDRTDEMLSAWGTVGTFVRNQFAIMMQPTVDAITPFLMKIREAIQPVLNVIGKVMQLFGGAVGKVLSMIGAVLGPIIDAIGIVFDVIDKVADGIGFLFNFASGLVGGLASWIGDKIGGAWDWVADKAGGVWEFVKGKAGGFFSWLDEKTGGTGSWIIGKIGGAWDWVKEKAGDTWDWISDKAKGAWEWIKKTAGVAPAPAPGTPGASGGGNSPKVLEDIGKEVKKLEEEMNALGLTTEEALIKKFQNAGASEGALHLLKAMQEQMKEMKMQQAVKDATKSIDEMTAAIGKDAQEIQRMKLVAMGATDELAKFDEAVAKLKEKQAEQAGGDYLKDLQKQIATFGMDGTDIKILDLKDMGVSPEIIAQIEDAAKKIADLKKEAKADADWAAFWDSFDQAGKAIADSVKGPLVKLTESLADIDMQFQMGNLSADQYALAVSKAIDQADKLNDANISPTVSLQGSSAAYSAILAANRQGERNNEDPQARVARIAEQQRRIQELQLIEARRVAAAVERIPQLGVAGGL